MILLHNLSGVYEIQDFYKGYPHLILEEKNLSGVRGYMDEERLSYLKDILQKEAERTKIHFLDSGNYHHFSYLYTDMVKEKFVLIVYDNHTDMKESAFGNILSCGSWILESIQKNPFLEKVIMVGVKGDYIRDCPYQNHEKVIFLDSIEALTEKIHLPVYLSLDKDVLSEEEFVCDWDQGRMTLYKLIKELKFIRNNYKILGIDICGEPDKGDGSSISASNQINQNILNVFSCFFHL